MMIQAVVTGAFDDLRSKDVRFLEEASKLGELSVLVWSDQTAQALLDKPPKFPLEERLYFLRAIRFVGRAHAIEGAVDPDTLPAVAGLKPDVWVVEEAQHSAAKEAYCKANRLQYQVQHAHDLRGFPGLPADQLTPASPRKKVIVSGCYDWLHSGHVRFFEEVSELGELYVVLGHDANVRSLKGAGHPLFPQEERRYMVQSIRYVTQALVATGDGWLDAEPEIIRLKPEIYAVNEDGDRPIKREYCEKHGLEYCVLKRIPKAGLPRRQSTELRGF